MEPNFSGLWLQRSLKVGKWLQKYDEKLLSGMACLKQWEQLAQRISPVHPDVENSPLPFLIRSCLCTWEQRITSALRCRSCRLSSPGSFGLCESPTESRFQDRNPRQRWIAVFQVVFYRLLACPMPGVLPT